MPAVGTAEETLPGAEPVAALSPAAAEPPEHWHRGLSLLAVVSLFLALSPLWAQEIVRAPASSTLLMLAYGALLVCAVLACAVRTRRGLGLVDLAVLAVGAGRAALSFSASLSQRAYGTDEGVLVHQAALWLAHGHNPYTGSWPQLVDIPGVGGTPLMGGGAADTYGYPPLGAVLTAIAGPFTHGLPTAGVVSFGCELLAAAAMFALLPAAWRPSVPLLFFGLDFLAPYSRQGYVLVMALPLLVVAVAGWTRTGELTGRLGRSGIVRAVCLGLACATQQMAWFLAPFLVVGLFLVRRGELPRAAATRLTARYAGSAAAVFVLVNLPFAVTAPGRWLAGITAPLTQGAVPKGVGLIGIAYYLRGGSDTLDFYSYASGLLLLGALAALVVAPRRLGPAALVLPWVCFYLSTRSTDNYFTLLSPLWVTGLATAGPAAFARAWAPRPAWLSRERTRGLVLAGLAVPALLCAAIASFGQAPLRMRVEAWTGGSVHAPSRVVLKVTNVSGDTVKPHFGLSSTSVLAAYWNVRSGPRALRPGATGVYVLTPPRERAGMTGTGPVFVRAVSAGPGTVSSVRLK
jgi:hypothetical protein